MTTTWRTMLLAALLPMVALAPSPVFGQSQDPGLEQQLGDHPVVRGSKVLQVGHVDLGPRFDEGTWRLLVHDDLAKDDEFATSVWRHPDETVLRVVDESRLTVPDDVAYRFIGVEAGSRVWVIPQTQDPEVVWLGWNTQDPEVMKRIDRGVTLTLDGVQGPGTLTTYLQSGSFGEPQVLWDSRRAGGQPVWVDVNTHTHANWVFTEPGVYLVRLTAKADLIDGSEVADTQVLRFAVGSDTESDEALSAQWSGSTSDRVLDHGGDSVTSAGNDDQLVTLLVVAIALVAVLIIAGVTITVVRARSTRRRVAHLREQESS